MIRHSADPGRDAHQRDPLGAMLDRMEASGTPFGAIPEPAKPLLGEYVETIADPDALLTAACEAETDDDAEALIMAACELPGDDTP